MLYLVIINSHDPHEWKSLIKKIAILPFLLVLITGTAHADSNPVTIFIPNDMIVEATGFFTHVNVGTANASSSGKELEATNNAPSLFLVGDTTVTWFAHNGNGGYAIATQIITIQDTTPPVFSDFPPYVKFSSDTGKKIAVDFDWPHATDIADPNIEVTSSHKSGYKFPVGNTTITFTATDDSDNKISQNITIMVVDTRPRIQNLAIEEYHDRISVSWDNLEGHVSYRVMLTETDTGNKISTLTTKAISHTFMDLNSNTNYTVLVHAHGDKSTKVAINTSTIPLITTIEDFTDKNGWNIGKSTWVRPPGLTYNTYAFAIDTTTGTPASSAKIHGDGYAATTTLYKTFDLSKFGDHDVFMGIDFRATSYSAGSYITNLYFHVQNADGEAIYFKRLVGGGTTDSGWESLRLDITDLLAGTKSIRVDLGIHDLWLSNYRQVAYFDSFYLGTAPPPRAEIFIGGSDDSSDVQRILEQIQQGNTDPYKYVDGVRILGPYNDLVEELLRLNNVTGSQ